jgi:signal transduction histidine kinase
MIKWRSKISIKSLILGIGLGLAICKHLVSLVGPRDFLFLESDEGKGAKFTFTIYKNLEYFSLGKNYF